MPPHTRLLNRNFVLFWQGQFVSLAGSSLSSMALSLWVVDATGSATLLGTLAMATSTVNLVIGPFGGAVADRFSRRTILVLSDVAYGALAFIHVGLFSLYAIQPTATVVLLFTAQMTAAVVTGFFNPAAWAITPDLVPSAKVPAANALAAGSAQTAVLIGRGAGGLLYRLIGAPALFLLDGATFLFSAGSEIFICTSQRPRSIGTSGRRLADQLVMDIRQGLRYVWSRPELRAAVVLNAGMVLFLDPVIMLLPFFVKDPRFLGVPDDWLGYLTMSMGCGSLVGAAVAVRLQTKDRDLATLFTAASVAIGLGYSSLGFLRSPWGAAVLLMGTSAIQGLTGNVLLSRLQTRVPEGLRSRVLTTQQTLTMLAAPPALAVAGVAADASGRRLDVLFLVCGLGAALAGLYASTRSGFRRLLSTHVPLKCSGRTQGDTPIGEGACP